MEQIASVSTMEDSAHYGQVNLVELIHKVDRGDSRAAYYDTEGDQSMKRRIESFKVSIMKLDILSCTSLNTTNYRMAHLDFWKFFE